MGKVFLASLALLLSSLPSDALLFRAYGNGGGVVSAAPVSQCVLVGPLILSGMISC